MHHRATARIVLAIGIAGLLPVAAQEPSPIPSSSYKWSIAAITAGAAADSATTQWKLAQGCRERNPMSRNGAVEWKATLTGAWIISQPLLMRATRQNRIVRRAITISNYAIGATWAGVAAQNALITCR